MSIMNESIIVDSLGFLKYCIPSFYDYLELFVYLSIVIITIHILVPHFEIRNQNRIISSTCGGRWVGGINGGGGLNSPP